MTRNGNRPDSGVKAFCEATGTTLSGRTNGRWLGHRAWTGVFPPPDISEFFGKRSSCIVGASIPVSCAEVELVHSLRLAGWDAGWASRYRADPRFPAEWRPYLASSGDVKRIFAVEFPALSERIGSALDDGIPDVVAARDGRVVVAECKRERGFYLGADGFRRRFNGDSYRPSQEAWLARHRRPLAAAFVELWWTRTEPR